MLGYVDGDHPFRDIHLNRRQADARGRVHGLQHVVQKPADLVVHAPHGLGAIAQSRIRIVKNVAYGHRLVLN